MGDLGPFAILAFLWWIMSAVMEGRKKQQQRRRPPRVELPGPLDPARKRPAAGTPPTGLDPSQAEGSRLEQILREFEQALEQSTTVPAPTETRGGWDAPGEEFEERASHDDLEPEVESREGLENFDRPEREVVVLGGDQDALYRSRMAYAEVRSKALSKGDHAAFDARIRAPQTVQKVQADKATTARTMELRKAMIWREVLGPPVALRGMERE
jgi:hypothetical protein